MLRLSKNAWHFKLYTVFGLWEHRRNREPRNLCRYFWATVWGLVSAALLIAVLLGCVVGLVLVIVHYPLQAATLVLLIAAGTGGAILIWVAGMAYKRHLERRPPKVKQPNLLAEYIKAKKKRYCPSIVWRDGYDSYGNAR